MKMMKEMAPMKEESDESEGFDKYEIEDAVRTLIRAEEIKQDSKLMAACSASLEKQKKAIDSVAGLKAKAAELDKEVESPAEEMSADEEQD